jgi:hypothetical protein
MIDQRLHRKADDKHPEPLYTVSEDEAFDIIAKEHLKFVLYLNLCLFYYTNRY